MKGISGGAAEKQQQKNRKKKEKRKKIKRGTVRVKQGPRIQVNIYMSAQRGGKKISI